MVASQGDDSLLEDDCERGENEELDISMDAASGSEGTPVTFFGLLETCFSIKRQS